MVRFKMQTVVKRTLLFIIVVMVLDDKKDNLRPHFTAVGNAVKTFF